MFFALNHVSCALFGVIGAVVPMKRDHLGGSRYHGGFSFQSHEVLCRTSTGIVVEAQTHGSPSPQALQAWHCATLSYVLPLFALHIRLHPLLLQLFVWDSRFSALLTGAVDLLEQPLFLS